VVGAVLAGPVAVRRRWPQPALAVAAVGALLACVLGAAAAGVIVVSFLPTVLVLYVVAGTASKRRSATALVGCLVAARAAIGFFYRDVLPTLPPAPYRSELPPLWPVELGMIAASMAGAWVAGLLVRSRRDANARLAGEIAHAAAVEERLRISRELHDIIGHSLSLIAVKATVANHVADVRPDEARAALSVIEHTSRTTLTEIRRVLGALRSDAGPPHVDMPRAGLDGLPELADRVTSTGLAVDLDISSALDDGRPLPTSLGVSVYRIVQEALTNVVAHSAATRCRVAVHVGRREVTIEVTDPGPPRRPGPVAEGGYGLIGMRERALLYGGTFEAGPDRDGGFRVSARLPYESAGAAQ